MTNQGDTEELAPCEQLLEDFTKRIHRKLTQEALRGHIGNFRQHDLFSIIIAEMGRIAIAQAVGENADRYLARYLLDEFDVKRFQISRALDQGRDK